MRPLRLGLAAALGAGLLAAGPAVAGMDHPGMGVGAGMATGAAGPVVSVGFAAFAPAHLDVVAGDVVRWSNDSARPHDIVAGDQSFDSGRVAIGDAFTHRFDTDGTVPYYCSLHPFMTGEVDVHGVLLDAPTDRAGAGKPFVLSGRAAAGVSGSVTIEGDDGAGFRRVGSAAVGADGTFRATVVPRTSTSYRAAAGDRQSPPVQLLVLDRTVTVSAARHGGATMLAVRVTPASPGAPVVLQLRLRDRFGWWPVGRAKLGKDSTAQFMLRRGAAVPARVLLTLPDGATELARSATVQAGGAARA